MVTQLSRPPARAIRTMRMSAGRAMLLCSILDNPRELAAMTVRSMSLWDILPTARILSDAFDGGTVKQAMGLQERMSSAVQLVHEENGALDGYAEYWTAAYLEGREIRGWKHGPPDAYVSSLTVAKASRRRGAATALMRAMEQRAQREGHRHISLQVEETNEAALALYASLNYSVIGRDGANVYRGVRFEPRFALRKELPSL